MTYPFVHIGAGISAAPCDWYLAVIFYKPVEYCLQDLKIPGAFDDIIVKDRVIVAGHGSGSLPRAVAAVYGGGKAGNERGAATDRQWEIFNADVDRFLMSLHKRASIAAVIRTFDRDYSISRSEWHAWSCRELPKLLPFLATALAQSGTYWLDHACYWWRTWLHELPLKEQKLILAGLTTEIRAVFRKHGGAPKPMVKEKVDKVPSLDEQKAVWTKIATDPNVSIFEKFKKAFAHLRFGTEHWELWDFVQDLTRLTRSHSEADDELAVKIIHQALKTPGCSWSVVDWRPVLTSALLRLGCIDEAREHIPYLVITVNRFSGDWMILIRYLDAIGRFDDGDVLYHVCRRYFLWFYMTRKRARNKPGDKERAAHLVLELSAPLFADFRKLDHEDLRNTAEFFEDLVKKGVATDILLPWAARARAEVNTPRQKRRPGAGRESAPR